MIVFHSFLLGDGRGPSSHGFAFHIMRILWRRGMDTVSLSCVDRNKLGDCVTMGREMEHRYGRWSEITGYCAFGNNSGAVFHSP